jgi:hypothetical protein
MKQKSTVIYAAKVYATGGLEGGGFRSANDNPVAV